MVFQSFVQDEHKGQKQHERPTGRKCTATEIENQKSTKQPPKGKLDNEEQPEVDHAISLGRKLAFVIFVEIYKEYAKGRHAEVRANPKILPEQVNAL